MTTGKPPRLRKGYRGLNKVRRVLSDGQVRVYYYHRASGTRIDAVPGTPAFDTAYEAARRGKVNTDTFAGMVAAFKTTTAFTDLADKTRKDYTRFLDMLVAKFGKMPAAAMGDQRVRGDFMAWRDGLADRPRTADMGWSVLSKFLSWAYDRRLIAANHALRGGRLYASERSDIVWTPADVAAFMAVAARPLQRALALALYTGQRQGDLLRLTWANVAADSIALRQGKRRRQVAVPIHPDLHPILEAMRAGAGDSLTVLTSAAGKPWKADHFRHEWRAATLTAKLNGLHFHDLRGTSCTLLAEAGCTTAEVAALLGWSTQHADAMLQAYTAQSKMLAVAAMRKLGNESRTVLQNAARALQNGG